MSKQTYQTPRQTLDTLKEKQAFLSAIIESSFDAIISKDLNGLITSWNRGAERIFGYRQAEVIGQHVTILIPLERRDEENYIISQIRNGKRIDPFNTIRLSKKGAQIPVSLTVSPIKDTSGHIIGASKIARDISADINIRQEMDALLEKLKVANERKNEFIALVSHELKTPLTSISGFLQVIGRKTKETITQKFVNKSLEQVRKLNKLINELLDISRIEAGKLLFSKEQFDFCELVADAVESVRYTFPSHTFHFDGTTVPVPVMADRQRLEQVLFNLFSNAVKYSPLSSTVHVRLQKESAWVRLAVKDEGRGLTEAQQQKLFTRFYRAEGVERIQGLGLGLFLCKEIVERHGGQIGVKSDVGKGSEFYVTIPINGSGD